MSRLSLKLPFTGDEPRYLLYAISVARDGRAVLTPESYDYLLANADRGASHALVGYPYRELQADRTVPWHSMLLPLLLAPLTGVAELHHIRLLSLLAALVGLFFLGKTLLTLGGDRLSPVVCFIPAIFAFPALPYFFFALPEVYLFTLSCIVFWDLFRGPGSTLPRFLPSIICGCAAPFFHLRGVPLFVVSAAVVATRLFFTSDKAKRWPCIVLLSAIYLAALAALITSNLFVHGSILGSVTTARPSWSAGALIPMFISYRHGLFTYSPIWLLSFAGLIVGLCHRAPWATPAALFIGMFLLTSSGPDPGECYPARFWVQAVPVLAIAMLGFIHGWMGKVAKVILYGGLFSISAVNVLLFFAHPHIYLEGRVGAYPYDFLFGLFPRLHGGFWLDSMYNPAIRAAVAIACSTVIALCAAASLLRSRVLEVLAVIVFLGMCETHRTRLLTPSITTGSGLLKAELAADEIAGNVLMRLRVTTLQSSDFRARVMEVSHGETRTHRAVEAAAILHTPPLHAGDDGAPMSIAVTWFQPVHEEPPSDASVFQVVASNSSIIRALWPFLSRQYD